MSDSSTAMHSSNLKRPLSEPSSPTGSSTLDSEHDQHPRRRPRIDSPVIGSVGDPSLAVPLQEHHPTYTDTFEFGYYVPWADLTAEHIEVVKEHWDTHFLAQWNGTDVDMDDVEPAEIISDLGLGVVHGIVEARQYLHTDPAVTRMIERFQEEYENLEYYYNLCTHRMPQYSYFCHITNNLTCQLFGVLLYLQSHGVVCHVQSPRL